MAYGNNRRSNKGRTTNYAKRDTINRKDLINRKLKFGSTMISDKNDILEKRARKFRKRNIPQRPIEDEENRIPDKYEGDITFTRTIYSKGDFNRKVNTGFSELNSEILPIEVEQFFNYYNEIFFDIPKEGENSHSTIIETSLDYVESYNNPLQGVVDNLNTQVEELEAEIRRLNNEIQTLLIGDEESLTDSLEAQQENAEQQAKQAEYDAYVAQIGGDVNNPIITYNSIKTRLGPIISGLNKNKRERREKDLRQAYEKARATDLGYSNRKVSEWKADIKKSSSGDKQADIFKAVDGQAQAVKDKANQLNPN